MLFYVVIIAHPREQKFLLDTLKQHYLKPIIKQATKGKVVSTIKTV